MLELGEKSVAAHSFIGKSASRLGIDYLLVVGSFAAYTVAAARQAGMARDRASAFASKDELVAFLKERVAGGELTSGDWLLLKGSRGMRMESLIAPLAEIGAGV
jgi:murE/murF fusion protein